MTLDLLVAKTIALLMLKIGVSREFPSDIANRAVGDSSDALLYQLSYRGGKHDATRVRTEILISGLFELRSARAML